LTEAVDAPRLPDDVVALLDGRDLERRVGHTIELLTVGPDGWPGLALLSAGEVLALDGTTVRLALWPASRTTSNLNRTGRGTLALVHAGGAYTVRIHARRLGELPGPLAAFEAEVAAVRRDEVGYARLRSGITFDLPDAAAVVGRWRTTVDALRSL
jgi:hypothetical protein